MTDKKKTRSISALASHTATTQHLADTALSPRARQLHLPSHKLFRFHRVKHPVKLPSALQLTGKTYASIRQHWRILLGIAVVYGILSIVFVHGLSSTADVQSLKQQIHKGFSGNIGQLTAGFSSFTTVLAGSNSSVTAAAGVYQMLLGLIVSLATIWTLRQVLSGERVRIRDAFYKSTAQLIPFILVLTVMLIQLLPLLIGGALYTMASAYGIAITMPEKVLWGSLFVILAVASIYMLCSSLFALYIVTLADMTPIRALRSARQLVRYRRVAVLRKLLFLPCLLGILAAIIMVPIVLYVVVIAQWIFFLLGVFGLVILHTYLYTLYRELLV